MYSSLQQTYIYGFNQNYSVNTKLSVGEAKNTICTMEPLPPPPFSY